MTKIQLQLCRLNFRWHHLDLGIELVEHTRNAECLLSEGALHLFF